MGAWIRQLLTLPVFEDEEKTRVGRLLYATLLILLPVMVVVSIVMLVFAEYPLGAEEIFTLLSTVAMMAITLGFLVLTRRGFLRLPSIVLVSVLWLLMTIWVLGVSGSRGGTSILAFPLIVVLAGVLLGPRAAFVYTTACIATMLAGFYVEATGILVVEELALSPMDILMVTAPLVLIALLLRNAMNSLSGAVARARENERAQAEANRELKAIRASLEERVAERTRELERRSAHLEAAAEVGRTTSSVLETERLVWQVTDLIRQRFNLYHVGLFLVDESGRWAECRAGAGVGAQELLAEGFRLPVGGESMVGSCTANGRQQVAQDVTTETRRIDHPRVPDIRSEAALPLLVHDWVVGALSVQSDRPHAFDEDTLAALQTIADQVAVALDNARLFAEAEAALEAERRAYGEISHQAWAQLVQARPDWGYLCGQQGTVSPAPSRWQPEMIQATETGKPLQMDDLSVVIPITIQDHTTGAVRLRKRDDAGPWTEEEIELMRSLAEQLGVTIESARLHQEAQRRAMREQLVAQVSAAVRASLDPDTILKTGIRELGRVLGAERAAIEITGPVKGTGRPEVESPPHVSVHGQIRKSSLQKVKEMKNV